MTDGSTMWFSVRCILRHGDSLYEERVVLLRADSFEHAVELAEAEASEYAEDLAATEYVGLAQAYQLADDPADSPAEVFSLIRESDLPPGEYLDRFFDTGTERSGGL